MQIFGTWDKVKADKENMRGFKFTAAFKLTAVEAAATAKAKQDTT
jgi:hypothetical protein